MMRRPPRSTLSSSSAASDVYKIQINAEYGKAPTFAMDLEAAQLCSDTLCQHLPAELIGPTGTSTWIQTASPYQSLVLSRRPPCEDRISMTLLLGASDPHSLLYCLRDSHLLENLVLAASTARQYVGRRRCVGLFE
eukprot:TRINITY_DN3879_c0_g1_i1.p1 TRINITY_DN3879_c0_g1~~TRINITY_DN3879_c0_g1_i1.p1  ORF type:complete len:136 (+),score=15.12 TRINITY_DN3879_c0_g1_i1:100-507(+)